MPNLTGKLKKMSTAPVTSNRRRKSSIAVIFSPENSARRLNFLRQFRDSVTHEWKCFSAIQFADVWKHYDVDGNGYIEGSELDAFLCELVTSVVADDVGQEVISPSALRNLRETFLAAYDENGDNRIDISEMAQVLPTEECFLLLFRHENPLPSSVDFMRVWKEFDRNSSGYIEVDELESFLQHLLRESGKSVTSEQFREYSDTILLLFDTNHDGKLQLSEMARLLPVKENYLTKPFFRGTLNSADVSRIFRRYDVDHDGQIEGIELDGLLKDLLELTEREYSEERLQYLKQTVMEQWDANGDGKIDREELHLMLQQQQRLAKQNKS